MEVAGIATAREGAGARMRPDAPVWFPSWTGEFSYSVYLTRACLIAIVTPLWSEPALRVGLPDDLSRIVMIVTCLTATLAVSQPTCTHVVRSSRRHLRQLLLRPARSLAGRPAYGKVPAHPGGAQP